MNDTHGQQGEGWIGFDLDGTLAKYDGWKGIDHIGEPVKPMVELIKRMHDEGKVVKIMTARVAPKEKPEVERNPFIGRLNPDYAKAYIKSQEEHPSGFYSLVSWGAREFISDWCLEHLGFLPEIVYQKDHLMLELYDDRVKQVVPNEGWLVEDIAMSKRHVYVRREVEQLDIRWPSRVLCVLLGMLVAGLVMFAVHVYIAATTTVPEAEQKLNDAVQGYIQSKLNERAEELLR